MTNRYTLTRETELRCEIPEGETLTLTLVSGNAEIFGVELVASKTLTFTDDNIAVFSWYGCVLEASGENSTIYVADSTPMVSYVNTHMQLEARRDVALANGDMGPRVLITGPSDHGKSTTCRILSSYACRLDRSPLFIDLDVGQTSVVPGSICAIPLNKYKLNVQKGFDDDSMSPLVQYFGHAAPKENVELYKFMVSTLADKVNTKLESDVDARSAGFFVNTTGFIDGEGFDLLKHCISALAIDIVLVMGHDRLYSSLSASLPQSVALVKLPKSGGVVQRERAYRSRHRRSRIWEYFYGSKDFPYSPARTDVKISSVCLLRAGGLQVSSSRYMAFDLTDLTDFLPFLSFLYL
jgi:polyribonucleotide 5'-hydroxyl-kinase